MAIMITSTISVPKIVNVQPFLPMQRGKNELEGGKTKRAEPDLSSINTVRSINVYDRL